MIDPKARITYAQFNEDIILLALLHDVKKGFYVDIGANYPTIDSVTKIFYEKGWRGINIEPIKSLHDQIQSERPEDINLNIGIGSKKEERTFYENLEESGHSSFIENQAGTKTTKLSKVKMKIERLDTVLSKYAKNKTINFMKIDVEGFEPEVIAGNDWKKFRPEVICVEANHAKVDWRKTLVDADYKLFIADGLNEYYIAKESWSRTKGYEERAVEISYRSLRQHQAESWQVDSKMLEKLTNLNEAKEQIIKDITEVNKKLQKASELSMKYASYPKRIKVALVGLTSDWIKYKRSNK